MTAFLWALAADEQGTTAVEYGLIAALVSLAGVTALQSTGASLSGIFSSISGTLESAAGGLGP
ncbi:MAG: Flp family type IVb pilin [Alphaproteobacteria bacterium]